MNITLTFQMWVDSFYITFIIYCDSENVRITGTNCEGLYAIKKKHLAAIYLSRGEGCDPIGRFLNSTTLLCLSWARTWISNAICRGLFFVLCE